MTRIPLLLTVPLLCLGAAQDPGPDPIPGLLERVEPARLMETVEALVGFHTRNTLSETDSDTRGIGAARRWIERRLQESAVASGGRLEVGRQTFTASMGPRGDRREVELVNVFAFLPGTQGDRLGRTYVVSAHYDSIASDRWDTEAFAPGADDDASGVAVVLELARVMSQRTYEANLVFLCVPGEEQGLYGSTHYAEQAQQEGVWIDGMLTNDIVGGVEGGNGVRDDVTIRCFSAAEGLNSPSRELARLLREAADRYVPDGQVKLIFRLDRFGRGGDHRPFHERGMPAIRLTEANEYYARQHQDVREEGGETYGDLPEYVSADYMGLVARVNLAALARLALAPAPPRNVTMRAAVRYDTRLRFEASPSTGPVRYQAVWRETTAPVWEDWTEPTDQQGIVVPGRSADNLFFAVRAVNAWGHASRAILPDRP